ncbi:MAG: ABC transporter substrate-binding protein [Rhodospirillaceae bacterium]|nr:ABC transporter substrate-binding protein [Rhodospirillaceae bacterium]
MADRFSRREVLQGGCAALSASALPACSRSDFATSPGAALPESADFGPYAPESGRLVTDPAAIPRTFNESPTLAELVAAGRLDPVGERIGHDPIVIEPLHGIGRYGGTLRRAFVGPGDQWGLVRMASGPDSFLHWDKDWRAVRPNIARDFRFSDDYRVLTLSLRRGMRWSDGAPFTADDVLFWYRDLYLDRRIVAAPSASMLLDNRDVLIEKLDDFTVRFVAPQPYEVLAELLASSTDLGGLSFYGRFGMGGYAPQHYLSQFHPKYRSESEVSAVAREQGFANWSIYLRNRNDWSLNPELPVLSPWRLAEPINSRRCRLERNPYSVWVDSAGNQLPYIDSIRNILCANADAVSFKAVAGQLDFQNRHLKIEQLPFLLSNRRRSGYNVYLDPNEGTDLGLRVNLSYRADAEIGGWLGNPDFRRALSLGVDRQEINETLMLGLGRPSASVPAPNNRYFPGDEWVTRWAEHDVPRANGLLDELGLTARDEAGYRLRMDGAGRLRLNCVTAVSHFDYTGVAEMVREQWRSIGVDLDVEIVDQVLYNQRSMSGEVQLGVLLTGSEDPYVYPELLFPYTTVGFGAIMGVDFAQWFRSGGTAGVRPPEEIVAMMELWQQGRRSASEQRLATGRELLRRHVDLVISIGLVSNAYSMHGIHLAKNNLGNVPRRVVNTQIVLTPATGLPMTFFYREREDNDA